MQGALADEDPRVRRSAFAWLEALEPRTRLPLAAAGLRDPIRSVRLEAARVLAAVPAEALGPARSAFEHALGEYEAAQRSEADTPEAQLNLALLELSRGRPERAEAACREALAIDPGFAPASASLADVYRSQGREEEGERVLREGLVRSPEDAALHHALGLLLVRRGRTAEALQELERAAALAPDEPRFAYVLGVALPDTGRGEQGLRILREAAARFPAYLDLEAALRAFESEAR